MIEYPFSFSDLLNKIKNIFTTNGVALPDTQKDDDDNDENANKRIEDRMFDLNISVDEKLKEIAGLMLKQWAFPFTIIKGLNIIGSENSCCKELAACINSDLTASTAVIKAANTVHYAKRKSLMKPNHLSLNDPKMLESLSLVNNKIAGMVVCGQLLNKNASFVEERINFFNLSSEPSARFNDCFFYPKIRNVNNDG